MATRTPAPQLPQSVDVRPACRGRTYAWIRMSSSSRHRHCVRTTDPRGIFFASVLARLAGEPG